MTKAQRLLKLIDLLRQYRYPVTGQVLADKLQISLRTLYRDIAALQQQGARIDGEPGLGYMLRPGFLLPPLMFDDDELQALALGLRWVRQQDDAPLAQAATGAMQRIAAVLPIDLRDRMQESGLLPGPRDVGPPTDAAPLPQAMTPLSALRQAIRDEQRVRLRYLDLQQRPSERLIWPIALGYFDKVRVLIAWCEQRADFRHFRADRIVGWQPEGSRYPVARKLLLQRWRQHEQATDRI